MGALLVTLRRYTALASTGTTFRKFFRASSAERYAQNQQRMHVSFVVVKL